MGRLKGVERDFELGRALAFWPGQPRGQESLLLHKRRGPFWASVIVLVSTEPQFTAALALVAQVCSPEGFCGPAVGWASGVHVLVNS